MKGSDTSWHGKVYKSYETERAGKRGEPSEYYAERHPFPTYSSWGIPEFVDQIHRQYRIADGFDALEFDKKQKHWTNSRWNPSSTTPENTIPGRQQMLYVRVPISLNKGKSVTKERISLPNPNDGIVLIHLGTKTVYTCIADSVDNPGTKNVVCGSLVIKKIKEIGECSGSTAMEIKMKLQRRYKKLIAV